MSPKQYMFYENEKLAKKDGNAQQKCSSAFISNDVNKWVLGNSFNKAYFSIYHIRGKGYNRIGFISEMILDIRPPV